MANVSFFPWLRRGLGVFLEQPSEGTRRAVVNVRLTLDAIPKPASATPAEAAIAIDVVGPGDIAGLDTRVITRTWPRPDVTDAETAFFPLVEFSEPDLPWRYTPDRPTEPDGERGGDTLPPWLVLLTLGDDEWVPFRPADAAGEKALPAIQIVNAVALPPLEESFAWAHLQVSGDATDLSTILSQHPERAVSRIFCPRRLAANKPYTAFLVPAFKAGVLAGLGEPIPETVDALAPAWVQPSADDDADDVILPVYYQWRFHTGEAGSFEDLARRLVPRVLAGAAYRDMDVTAPGFGIVFDPKDPKPGPVPVEGALRPVGAQIPSWSDKDRAAFAALLIPKLNAPARALREARGRPALAPPLYGQWHAAAGEVGGGGPPWFDELNLAPQLRVLAGLGTQVVQTEQAALLASAWNQVDGLRQANQELREAQLGRESALRLFSRHVKPIPRVEPLFQLASPVLARVLAQPPGAGAPAQTVQGAFDESPIPAELLGGAWRRLGSLHGRVGRRQGRARLPLPAPGTAIIEKTNAGTISPAPTPAPASALPTADRAGAGLAPECLTPDRLDTLGQVPQAELLFRALVFFSVGRSMATEGRPFWLSRSLLRLALSLIQAGATANGLDVLRDKVAAQTGTTTPEAAANAPTIEDFQPQEPPPENPGPVFPPPRPGATDGPELAAFRQAAAALLGRLPEKPVEGRKEFEVDLADLAGKVLSGLDPALNLNPLAGAKVSVPQNLWNPADPLEAVMAAPQFPQPMYEPLRDLSLEWILPGLATVPADTVALLETNQQVIEAYMAGLNHEMSRELLWNEYPTDQRGTYFRQFWDVRASVTTDGREPDPEQQKDIRPMHTWKTALGTHASRDPASGDPEEPLVLFLRGELLQRYPQLIVYVALAGRDPITGRRLVTDAQEYPRFSGNLGSDTGFYGFRRTRQQIEELPGFYFVLQEPPHESRFTWQNQSPPPLPDQYARFGQSTAAQVACAALSQPTRVAIFGSAMLPPPSEDGHGAH
jgi:hypothetical protein